jgi:uncharacterized phage protein gp47/JayE
MAAQNNTTNKSEFIRQQPAGMSVADVVEKAKAEGLTIDAGLVYGVRSQAKAKGKAKKAGAKRASTGSGGAAAKPAQTKADFVRAHPNLTPMEIVTKAKEAGVGLEIGYVYNVRTSDKRARKKKTAAQKAIARPAVSSAVTPVVVATEAAETLLKAFAAEVGLARAIGILEGERARLRALIKG